MIRKIPPRAVALLLASALGATAAAHAETVDEKAARVESQMTQDERLSLLVGVMPIAALPTKLPIPPGTPVTAGYVPGVARLGVPAQLATDASLGVVNPGMARAGDVATAMPSGLALASSFDPALAERLGGLMAREARAKGFNVLLAGGLNLARDPRNGRNFEYLGEDPLLAGTLAGRSIRGIQAQGVASTIKHFALNAQETQRFTVDSVMDEAGMRQGELLAFQLGIEIGQPASVMCAYNRVNGQKACGSDHLLNEVLKRDWGYKGWVMSDWGAVDDAGYFQAGLDQQAGSQLDKQVWFGEPLRKLIENGQVPQARLADAVRRMLRSLYAVGIEQPYTPHALDYAANAQHALEAARAGIVLLRNQGVLPLAAADLQGKRVLVVGGNADFGTLAGGGSSQVTPSNGAIRTLGGAGNDFMTMFTRQTYLPGAPLAALKAALPKAQISFNSGYSVAAAAAAATHSDLVIVFATKWEGENQDSGDLSLPEGQDALIARLAAANPRTVVVLETGNPVTMPWLDQVAAVVQAWYPGQEGGRAIADVLTGAVNPAGRLPMSFPRALSQLRQGALPGLGMPSRTEVKADYAEGSEAGYRWLARTGAKPLFPFGFGLSYTRFSHGKPFVRAFGSDSVELGVTVGNDGAVAGADVPQAYLVARNGRPLQRLVGFQKVDLQAGAEKAVRMAVDPRLLADFVDGGWTVPAGVYSFAFGRNAGDLGAVVDVALPGSRLRP